MRRLIAALGLVTVAALLFVGTIYLASELGPEIVTLRTTDAHGGTVETRLWVVEHDGASWLRAGVDGSGWLARLEAHPEVEVERGGRWTGMRAIPVRGDPATRDRIHALMAEKYGLSDRLISSIRDGDGSIPVRLEPAGE
jgi:hypothetical protein